MASTCEKRRDAAACRQGAAVRDKSMGPVRAAGGCALGCKYGWHYGLFSALWSGPGYFAAPLALKKPHDKNTELGMSCLPSSTCSQLGFLPPDTFSAPFAKVRALASRLYAVETECLLAQSS